MAREESPSAEPLLRPFSVPSRPGPVLVLAVATLGAMLVIAGLTLPAGAFSGMRSAFEDGEPQTRGWVIGAYTVVLAATVLLGVRVSRRLGRRRLYTAAAVVFAAASAAGACAPDLNLLVGARVVQALAGGALMLASVELVVATFAGRARGRALTLWGGGLIVAAALGSWLGAVSVRADENGWRWALLGLAVAAVVLSFVAARSLTDGRALRPRLGPGLDAPLVRGAALAGLVALIGGASWLDALAGRDGASALVVAAFALSAALVVLLAQVRSAAELTLEERESAKRLHVPTEPMSAARGRGHEASQNEPPILSLLPAGARQRLTSGTPRHIAAGEWIVRQGETARSMFVITSGRADVIIGGALVRELGPGAVVGELALLTGRPRSASVRARRDCDVIEVPRKVWDEVMATEPDAVGALVTSIAGRLADIRPHSALTGLPPKVIGIVAATSGSATAGRAEMAEDVARAVHDGLSRHGAVTSLRPTESARLEAAERDHDWVVLAADGSDPQWTDYVRRQCDRLVVVADSAAPPLAVPRDEAYAPELVLVGRRPGQPTFAAWREAIDPSRVTLSRAGRHHVDLRHLVDRLAGCSVGVVLSGGGARALSHVGVLLELEEGGIEVDRVAGASLGAIVGAVYAAGISAAELADRAYATFVRGRPLGDYSLTGQAITRGVRHRQLIERQLGDLLIDELPRGFQCVSVDLQQRDLVVHRSGPAAFAVTASSRLPIVFPPIVDGPRLLVDGGVLDNLPVGLLTGRHEGPVIAVNVQADEREDNALSDPGSPLEVPTLMETLMRTMEINAAEEARAIAAGAYLIAPRTLGIGVLEFHHFDRMVASGRAAAREFLEATGGVFDRG